MAASVPAKTTATSRAKAKATVSIPQLGWEQVRPSPVVLISGTESFLGDRTLTTLRELLRATDPSLEVSDIDASTYSPGELLTFASPSLFGEPRFIRADNVEKCTDAFIEEVIDYLAMPADDTVLVLRHRGGVRGKKLLDAVRSAQGIAIEIVCTEIKKEADRAAFAAAEFRSSARRITPGALRQIVSAFAGDLAELAAACRQLMADTTGEITEPTVERYYGGRVEANAFQVADTAIAGHYGEALIRMRHALASGADPVPMVAAFASKFRTMAKVSGTRGSGGAVGSQLGLAPWQVDRARRDLQGWDDAGLGRCIELVAETDAAVKGAERDPVFALERMITLISARGVTR